MGDRLSEQQIAFLLRAKRGTMTDDAGRGCEIFGDQVRTANALEKRGLVSISMPYGGAPWGWAKITKQGRAVLSSTGGDRG